MKKYIIAGIAAWIALVSGSFLWNYSAAVKERKEIALQSARSFFDQIVITRKWNAHHGGVYVPVTETTQPNPYLPIPGRVLMTDTGLSMTKINPAYMTREISEIASRQEGGVKFHITSLRPLRPENAATPRERLALEAFGAGEREIGKFTHDGGVPSFFYMAPLMTEKACLQCHASQGYKEGDIRGGISVTMPLRPNVSVMSLAAGHALIGLAGIIGILFSGSRIEIYTTRLQEQAVIDALTGIPNRRSFSATLLREFSRAKREQKPLSVIMCDVDHFKLYNDNYGHTAGDDCLKQVAATITGTLNRPTDFCARYGGEEFMIILPNTDETGALEIAERVRAAVQSLGIPHDKSLPLKVVTLSLGVATMDSETILSDEELVKRADDSLYQAKENGRNSLVPFKVT